MIYSSISTSKNSIMESLFQDYGNNVSELFPEIEEQNLKRKNLIQDLALLKKSSQEITKIILSLNQVKII